jgi:hypothetical protein
MSDDIGAKMVLHDALTREIYGCSLDEFGARTIEYGRRLERNKEPVKPAKRPREMAPELVDFMVCEVDRRPDGVSTETAVTDFLKTIAIGCFVRGLPSDLPDREIRAALRGQPANLPDEIKTKIAAFSKHMKLYGAKFSADLPHMGTAVGTYYRERDAARQRAAQQAALVKSLKNR